MNEYYDLLQELLDAHHNLTKAMENLEETNPSFSRDNPLSSYKQNSTSVTERVDTLELLIAKVINVLKENNISTTKTGELSEMFNERLEKLETNQLRKSN